MLHPGANWRFRMPREDEGRVMLNLPADVVKRIDTIAAYIDRDRQDVVLLAPHSFLAKVGADILDEAEGFAELDRAEGIAPETVLAEARIIGARSERQD